MNEPWHTYRLALVIFWNKMETSGLNAQPSLSRVLFCRCLLNHVDDPGPGRTHLYSNVFLLHPRLRATLSVPTTPIRRLGTLHSDDGYSTEQASPESPTLHIRRNRQSQPRAPHRKESRALTKMVLQYDHVTGNLQPWHW